jgi:asparagine synthetase B (glutamine-hydrolysing)
MNKTDALSQRSPIPLMNLIMPDEQPPMLTLDSPCVEALDQMLRRALQIRIQNVPEPPHTLPEHVAKIAVLFSGGVDCTVLARLAHDILPIDEAIDLLNVAFENPRVIAASGKKEGAAAYEDCPDRITGRAAHSELQRVCPNRLWRFVAVNIPYRETLAHRDEVQRLMRPHNTQMDLSIACALFFASRGHGTVSKETGGGGEAVEYTTTARVLLSGLGADELFAGYTRHSTAFSRHGFQGLIGEINLDISRLGKRNLGRDDRVISTWGREARYPYLDVDFLSWAVRLPVWEKCGFGSQDCPMETGSCNVHVNSPNGTSQEANIEPGKKVLRLVAFKLGMTRVALEKKRAIQFGSRTAKMESGRTKGTHVLT